VSRVPWRIDYFPKEKPGTAKSLAILDPAPWIFTTEKEQPGHYSRLTRCLCAMLIHCQAFVPVDLGLSATGDGEPPGGFRTHQLINILLAALTLIVVNIPQ